MYLEKVLVLVKIDRSLVHVDQFSYPNCELHSHFLLPLTNVSSRYKLKKVQQKLAENQTDGHKHSNMQGI